MESFGLLQLIQNLSASFPNLYLLLQATAYVLGVLSALFGVYLLYNAGNGKGGREKSLGWVWSFAAAVVFIYLPNFLEAGGSQLFGDGMQTSGLAYTTVIKTSAPLTAVAGGLQILGFCFSLRGLWVLRDVGINGNHGPGGSSFGKGFVQIFAGILLVHLKDFLGVISSLTGLNVGAGLF